MTDSKKIDDGGPAFQAFRQHALGRVEEIHPGLTVRDWFAGQALAALGAAFLDGGWHNPNDYQIGVMVKGAYRAADAMIAARKGGAQ